MNICSTCQGAQSECQERLDANAEYREQVNSTLAGEGLSYEKGLTNKNFLWLLVEEIGLERLRERVKRPLTNLKVGPFYGCYIVRPRKRLGIDEEHPRDHYLEMLIEALGGTVIEYAGHAQVLRLSDHHHEQGRLAQAGRPPPRRRRRRRRRLPGDALPAVPPEPRPAAAAGRTGRGPRAADAGAAPAPARRAWRWGSSRNELGLSRHVVRPTSVIDWSAAVVAAAA